MGEILSFGSSSKFKTDLGGNMRIIIVGGIAAGMSAAAKLRRTDRDAEIVVYEKSPHISFGACGLPYYVGGNFDNIDRMLVRTPEKVRETGIDVKVEHEVLSLDVQNKTIKVKDLQSGEIFSDKYDKLMIATGAATIIPPIENIETAYTLRSVEDGEKLKVKMQDESIKKVAVIGGGNVAIDCARTIKRLGAQEVKVIYRRAEEQMPAEVKEIQEAKEEEIEFLFQNNIVKILGKDKVEQVELIKTELVQKEGETRKVPVNIPQSNYIIDIDYIIMALGSKPDEFVNKLGLELNKWGYLQINEKNQTSNYKVFAGGDIAGTKGTVAWAARSGRDAAYSIMEYLK